MQLRKQDYTISVFYLIDVWIYGPFVPSTEGQY